LAGSSGANPFACIAAGIATLWGPAHGGANEACLVMLDEIQQQGGVAKIGEFIKKVKDKDSNVRLMGFGHRVYKNYDPRAKLMRETCHQVLEEAGVKDDPLFALAMKLEQIALEDEYFVDRKLYPICEDRRVHQEGEGQGFQRPADGFRPPGLQELRPACQAHARDLSPGARGGRREGRPAVRAGDEARADRPRGRVFRRPEAVPERRRSASSSRR